MVQTPSALMPGAYTISTASVEASITTVPRTVSPPFSVVAWRSESRKYDEPDDVSHRLPSASLTYQSKLPTSNSWPSRAVAFTWMIRNWPLAGGSEYSDSGSVVVSTFSTVIVPVSTPSSVTVPVSPTANVSGPVSSGSEMGSGSAMDDGIASGSSGVLSYGES